MLACYIPGSQWKFALFLVEQSTFILLVLNPWFESVLSCVMQKHAIQGLLVDETKWSLLIWRDDVLSVKWKASLFPPSFFLATFVFVYAPLPAGHCCPACSSMRITFVTISDGYMSQATGVKSL